ncbi:hypothetical protein ABW19_dt0200465 [Dactylella cylindrospora]|nr:hypothetical protein ABW19_dt0200465 [Dactylella cylindrospora]
MRFGRRERVSPRCSKPIKWSSTGLPSSVNGFDWPSGNRSVSRTRGNRSGRPCRENFSFILFISSSVRFRSLSLFSCSFTGSVCNAPTNWEGMLVDGVSPSCVSILPSGPLGLNLCRFFTSNSANVHSMFFRSGFVTVCVDCPSVCVFGSGSLIVESFVV